MRFNLLLEVLFPEKSSIVWTDAVQREPGPKQMCRKDKQDKNKKAMCLFQLQQ